MRKIEKAIMGSKEKIANAGIVSMLVFTVIVSSVALSGVASAATLTVNPDGTADYRTIQAAVDDAGEGDTVSVEPGVYHETVKVPQGNLTIESTSNSGENVTVVAVKANGTLAVEHTTSDSNGVLTLSNVSTFDQNTTQVGSSSEANYSTVSDAVANVSDGDKVLLEPGTYNESVNVTNTYVMFQSTNMSQNVTVDASNTSEGQAFRENENVVYYGSNIKEVNAVLGGGGSSESGLSGTMFGVPNFVWGIVVIAGLMLAYKRKEE